jgi:PIN domain nuclease of toxin-antitoxin system
MRPRQRQWRSQGAASKRSGQFWKQREQQCARRTLRSVTFWQNSLPNVGKRLRAVSSNAPILDTSVLLAILNDEPYEGWVLGVLEGAVMGAVNLAEVWTKLHEFGLTQDARLATLFGLLAPIEPFTPSQAKLTGDLRPVTKHLGLSLGDRACLAVAIESRTAVYTAERKWAELNLPCTVHLIR